MKTSLVSMFCLFQLPVFATVVIDQSFGSANTGGNNNAAATIGACCAFEGQIYTAGISGTLAGVSLGINEFYGWTYPLNVQIRAVNGGFPTKNILGQTTAKSNTVSFSKRIVQTAGTEYAIAVHFEGAPVGGNGVASWVGNIDGLYPGGYAVMSLDLGQTWQQSAGPSFDEYFTTYVNPAEPVNTPEPISPAVLGLGVLAILGKRQKT